MKGRICFEMNNGRVLKGDVVEGDLESFKNKTKEIVDKINSEGFVSLPSSEVIIQYFKLKDIMRIYAEDVRDITWINSKGIKEDFNNLKREF